MWRNGTYKWILFGIYITPDITICYCGGIQNTMSYVRKFLTLGTLNLDPISKKEFMGIWSRFYLQNFNKLLFRIQIPARIFDGDSRPHVHMFFRFFSPMSGNTNCNRIYIRLVENTYTSFSARNWTSLLSFCVRTGFFSKDHCVTRWKVKL